MNKCLQIYFFFQEGFSFEIQPKVRKATPQHNSNGTVEHEEITDDGENVIFFTLF